MQVIMEVNGPADTKTQSEAGEKPEHLSEDLKSILGAKESRIASHSKQKSVNNLQSPD